MEWVRQIAIIVVTLVAGGPGLVWLVDRLKSRFGLSGDAVMLLAAALSAVAAVAGLVVDGVISPENMQPENLSEIALGVFFASQVYYRMIQSRKLAAELRWARATDDEPEDGMSWSG